MFNLAATTNGTASVSERMLGERRVSDRRGAWCLEYRGRSTSHFTSASAAEAARSASSRRLLSLHPGWRLGEDELLTGGVRQSALRTAPA